MTRSQHTLEHYLFLRGSKNDAASLVNDSHPNIMILAFLSLPLLTLWLVVSPTVCDAVPASADDDDSNDWVVLSLLQYVCGTNELFSRAAAAAAAVCWAQWTQLALLLEPKWVDLLRVGCVGVFFGVSLAVVFGASMMVLAAGTSSL